MKLQSIVINDEDSATLQIFDEASRSIVEKTILRAMNNGLSINREGSDEWFDIHAVFDSTKQGSACFTWRGDKVLHTRIHVIVSPDNSVSRTPLRPVWRNFPE